MGNTRSKDSSLNTVGNDIGIEAYTAVAGVLFTVGAAGLLMRRNILIMLMGLELMLNALNLALVAFARFSGHSEGVVVVFFTMAIAAVEVALGLALVVALFKRGAGLEVR